MSEVCGSTRRATTNASSSQRGRPSRRTAPTSPSRRWPDALAWASRPSTGASAPATSSCEPSSTTFLTTEIEPASAAETDDPWHDLVTCLQATVDVLAGRQVVGALAREANLTDPQLLHRYIAAMDRPLRRAAAEHLVRPELEARDLAAVVVMALATIHPGDPRGADRRRYLALLVDGLRPAASTLPPPSTYEVTVQSGRGEQR